MFATMDDSSDSDSDSSSDEEEEDSFAQTHSRVKVMSFTAEIDDL